MKTKNINRTTVPAPETLTPQPTTIPGSKTPTLLRATDIGSTPIAPTSTAVLPSSTAIGLDMPCEQRNPGDGLLTLVTHEFGIARDYEPPDLVNMAEYFSLEITKGYPTQLRKVVVAPLREMIDAMLAEGLHPTIISGYRSYSAQAIAWNKWVETEPDRVNIISAPPGHSEHQLGTTIDFGSPELDEIVGQVDIEFHTYFYKTAEGQWLEANAHRFGFILSYPLEAMELTGFFYEPWHYRYVGLEMATALKNQGKSLIELLLNSEQEPCIP